MKRNFLLNIKLILLVPITFLILIGCGKKDENTVKIGAILPLTGGASYLGESVMIGMRIAFEDFNKKNKCVYVLVPHDTQSKLSNVNNIYQLIRSTNNPNVVLSWMSSVASNLVEVTEKDKTLLFVGAARPDLTSKNKLVLRLWPNAIDLAKIEADFIINKLKVNNVGIFYINDDYGISLADEISRKLKKSNIKIVFSESAATDVTDYKNIILKYRDKNIDLIYIAAYDKVYSYLIKPLKQYLGDIKVMTDLTFCNYTTLSDFGALSEGIYTIGTEVDNKTSQKEIILKLRDRVMKEFKKEPDFNTALGYDMAWTALESLYNTDGSSQKMKNYVINKRSFEGMSGNIIFEENGDAAFNLYLLKIENGNAIEIK